MFSHSGIVPNHQSNNDWLEFVIISVTAAVPVIHVCLGELGQVIGQCFSVVEARGPGDLGSEGLDARRYRAVRQEVCPEPHGVLVLLLRSLGVGVGVVVALSAVYAWVAVR
jgi:hypothetical protein